MFKGIHYRNNVAYQLQTFFKLRSAFYERYHIAASYIDRGESVIDFCSGVGDLQKYLPEGCTYFCVEASPEFIFQLRKKGVSSLQHDLHRDLHQLEMKSDAVVMLISLCHFTTTSADELLEVFKKIASKVVVVEDVVKNKRGKNSLTQKIINYLSATHYFVPLELLSRDEFREVMQRHGYRCEQKNERYFVGIYKRANP